MSLSNTHIFVLRVHPPYHVIPFIHSKVYGIAGRFDSQGLAMKTLTIERLWRMYVHLRSPHLSGKDLPCVKDRITELNVRYLAFRVCQ